MNLLLFLLVLLIVSTSLLLNVFYSSAIDQIRSAVVSYRNQTIRPPSFHNHSISIFPLDHHPSPFTTLMQTIGGLHMYLPDRSIIIDPNLHTYLTVDQQDELRHLVNVHLSDEAASAASIPVGHCVASPGSLSSTRPCSPDYLCAVRHNISAPGRLLIRTNPSMTSQICILSAVYGPESRRNDFLSMFLKSAIQSGFGQWNVTFLLSTQVDPTFDEPRSLAEFVDELTGMLKGVVRYRLHMVRYPLNRPLTDLAYKWNALGREVLQWEECEWMVQVIDDTRIEGVGWLDRLTGEWKKMGRGVVGDGWNDRLFNAMLVGREHLRIFGGNVWDPYMVNWHIDDWARLVYGPRYTRRVHFINHAKGSTAYQICDGAIWCRCGMRRDRKRVADFYGGDPYFLQLAIEGGEVGCEEVEFVRSQLDVAMLPVK